jgi:hypothetical protein
VTAAASAAAAVDAVRVVAAGPAGSPGLLQLARTIGTAAAAMTDRFQVKDVGMGDFLSK